MRVGKEMRKQMETATKVSLYVNGMLTVQFCATLRDMNCLDGNQGYKQIALIAQRSICTRRVRAKRLVTQYRLRAIQHVLK